MPLSLFKSSPIKIAKEKYSQKEIKYINPKQIRPNPLQPRKSFDDDAIFRLADSVSRYGIIQPLTVRKVGADFELVAGERRLRAATLLRMDTVPCLIINANSERSAEMAITENLLREDLNIFEEAEAIEKLLNLGKCTQAEIAAKLSLSQSGIANKLRILRLSENERELILKNNMGERHARAFLKLPPALRYEGIAYAASIGMNVTQTDEYIEKVLKTGKIFPETAQEKTKSKKGKQKRKILLPDLRLFYNTIDRSLKVLKDAGFSVSKDCNDLGNGEVLITVKVKR